MSAVWLGPAGVRRAVPTSTGKIIANYESSGPPGPIGGLFQVATDRPGPGCGRHGGPAVARVRSVVAGNSQARIQADSMSDSDATVLPRPQRHRCRARFKFSCQRDPASARRMTVTVTVRRGLTASHWHHDDAHDQPRKNNYRQKTGGVERAAPGRKGDLEEGQRGMGRRPGALGGALGADFARGRRARG